MFGHIKAPKGVRKNTEYGLLVFGSILMGLSIVIFVIYGLLHIAIECKSKLMIGTFISVVLSAGNWNRLSNNGSSSMNIDTTGAILELNVKKAPVMSIEELL